MTGGFVTGTARRAGAGRRVLLGALVAVGVVTVAVAAAVAASGPATPTITAKPANPTSRTSARFSFTETRAGMTYVCALDATTFTACSSPQDYARLGQGAHSFQVKALSGARQSAPASYTWTVDTSAPLFPSSRRGSELVEQGGNTVPNRCREVASGSTRHCSSLKQGRSLTLLGGLLRKSVVIAPENTRLKL